VGTHAFEQGFAMPKICAGSSSHELRGAGEEVGMTDETDLYRLSAGALAAGIRERRFSPVEVLDDTLARIEVLNPVLNAYCLVRGDEVREEARLAEAAVMRGDELGPLHGVPVSIKDITPTRAIRTTFGSRAFADHVPEQDAVLVERLRAAGALIVGKTNTPEFGNKGVTESPLFGRTNNPWRLSHSAGGSSGGAAAAVAAGMGPLGDGSDGAGSIRVPASLCGVVGLKPSFGRVPVWPRNGYETISHHGPLARTTADAALMLSVIAGDDPRDPYAAPPGRSDFVAAAGAGDITGWPIAFSADLGAGPVEPVVAAAARAAAQRLADLGATVEERTPPVPDPREAMAVIWRVGLGTIAHERVLPIVGREGMDPHLLELMDAARGITAVEHYRASQLFRQAFFGAMSAFFADYRLLVTPTLAVAPFPHPQDARPGPTHAAGREIDPFLGWLLTYHFNLTGQPAISIPCAVTDDGLPLGLQIVGRPGADADVIRAAFALEEALGSRQWPPVVGESGTEPSGAGPG
jgi:aspartyl-tRNA(Asn)/glutamyl-tRNA(Gln) amidotransferase subunit A